MDDENKKKLIEELDNFKYNIEVELERLNISNLSFAFMILEAAEKNLLAHPDDPKLKEQVVELRTMANEAMEEISEETMNEILDLHNKRVEDYEKGLKNE